MSEFIGFISKGRGGWKWTWEQIRYFQNDFQTWTGWHKLSTHWIYIVFLLKYSAWFVPGFSFINIHISLERSNSPKSVAGHLLLLLVATRMTSLKNILGRKSKNMWGKSRHWFILSSSHQVLIHLVNILMTYYGLCHSIYVPIYILIGQYCM